MTWLTRVSYQISVRSFDPFKDFIADNSSLGMSSLLLFMLHHVQLFCNPRDCSQPGSSAHRTSQARILEQVATSFSRDLADPRIEPGSPALAGKFFTTEPLGNKVNSYPLY